MADLTAALTAGECATVKFPNFYSELTASKKYCNNCGYLEFANWEYMVRCDTRV